MSISRYFSVLLVYFQVSTIVTPRRVAPPMPAPLGVLQTKYTSKDPTIQELLKYADFNKINDVEATFFVRISTTKYAVSVSPMNFFKAYQMCRIKGGYMIDSTKKFLEASAHMTKIDWPVALRYWIAATSLSRDGVFRWFTTGVDVVPSEFVWGIAEPKMIKESCVVAEKVEKDFVMKTVDCETRALALCQILEEHRHAHAGMAKRKKKWTMRMHSVFD